MSLTTQQKNDIVRRVLGEYTMQLAESVYDLIARVEYIVERNVPGHFIECGVWRGGSCMTMALTLLALDAGTHRTIYLCDTFAGNPTPEAVDVDKDGKSAIEWQERERTGSGEASKWCFCDQSTVERNVRSTGYPNFVFVKGKVEETLPALVSANRLFSLVRLDTDFYSSTICELNHLYPLLALNGVLIIDDYGHWAGSKKATDEYLAAHAPAMRLVASGYSVRVGIRYECDPVEHRWYPIRTESPMERCVMCGMERAA